MDHFCIGVADKQNGDFFWHICLTKHAYIFVAELVGANLDLPVGVFYFFDFSILCALFVRFFAAANLSAIQKKKQKSLAIPRITRLFHGTP